MTLRKPKLLELAPCVGDSLVEQRAPHFRRLLAFLLDVVLALAVIAVAVGAAQLVWPPESKPAVFASAFSGMTAGFLYLGFSPLLLGNSLGKWLFSLQLSSTNGQPFGAWRLFKRVLMVGFSPINLVLVLARSSRTHLGDGCAHTAVQVASRRRNFWFAAGVSTLLVIGALQLGGLASRVGMSRSEAWKTARRELALEPGAAVPVLPLSFSVLDNVAMFHADVGKGLRRIVLIRKDGEWFATDSQAVDTVVNSGTIEVAARAHQE